MLIPASDFRIDPSHSVSVFGRFDDELASRLVREIFELRKSPNSRKPITVFINSDGGDVRVLEILDGALNCQDQDGTRVRVITAVVGNAASAAADLLVYGDYAIAYPHSSIYFHGVRYSEIRQITAERAGVTTESLRRRNLQISYELARSMIPRIVHRYAILRGKIKRKRKDVLDKPVSELECFIDSIGAKVSAPTQEKLTSILSQVKTARHLMFSVMPKAQPWAKRKPIKQDETVLCALIRHEVNVRRQDESWRLDEEGISAVVNDYLILRDYLIGDHRSAMNRILNDFGVEFLTDSEYKRFSKIKDSKKSISFLREKAEPKLSLFWYYAVVLTRNLLRDENPISPTDAYWIGAIDEVVGQLDGRRAERERVTEQKPTAANSTPAPPHSTEIQPSTSPSVAPTAQTST
jgi:hypothetical protein